MKDADETDSIETRYSQIKFIIRKDQRCYASV